MVRFSGQSLLIVIGMDNDGNVVAHATHRCFVLFLLSMGLMGPFTRFRSLPFSATVSRRGSSRNSHEASR
jgi:hypothetical protein